MKNTLFQSMASFILASLISSGGSGKEPAGFISLGLPSISLLP